MKVLILAAALLTASLASADAVAGKNRFLVGGPRYALWVPLNGGPVANIFPVVDEFDIANGRQTSVATDGDRFLVAWCGSGAAIYEEGATSSVSATALAGKEKSRCFSLWDHAAGVAAAARGAVSYSTTMFARSGCG